MSAVPTGRAWLANHVGVLPPGLDVDDLTRELNRRLRKPVPPETVLLGWFEDANVAFVPDGDATRDVGSTTARVKEIHVGTIRLDANNVGIFIGSGTPEAAVTADIGSTFHRTDGGAATSFYVKESGTGDTGWVAK